LTAAFAVLAGWGIDRFGPKPVVSLMGAIAGLSLIITSQTESLWQILLSYSFLLAMGTGGLIPVLLSLVGRWFVCKRGFALGITTTGIGLGNMLIPLLTAYLISTFDWRMAYVITGIMVSVIVISLAMIFRANPAEMGLLPDGRSPSAEAITPAENVGNPQTTGFTLIQAIRARSFWLISVIWFFWGVSLVLVMTHVAPYAIDAGITTVRASGIFGIFGGCHILSRLLVGKLSDAVGRKLPAICSAIIGSGALVFLIWADSLWMFYLFAVIFGFSWGGFGVNIFALSIDIFSGKNLGVIIGALDIGYALGAAVGSVMGGFVFDTMQSYSIAFAIGAMAYLSTAFLVTLIRRETSPAVNLNNYKDY
jgi:MFS family permease